MGDAGIQENLQRRQAEIGLDPRDVGRQVVHAQPPHVTPNEISVMPTAEG
jgi:NADP-dependent 3-hydroxy acid dehydrogenase YdfG